MMTRTFDCLLREPRGTLTRVPGTAPDWFGTAGHYSWAFWRRGKRLFASVTNAANGPVPRLDDDGNEIDMMSDGDMLPRGHKAWYEVRT